MTRPASSPRPWRCFFAYRRRLSGAVVFSTSVEVFLRERLQREFNFKSSPRPWRCFRKITKETAAQSSLLHVRGGVSTTRHSSPCLIGSSPRPWRCFRLHAAVVQTGQVFSTSVEVFLKASFCSELKFGLLHVRGGVSSNLDAD